MDIERLIDCIRRHVFLYDLSHKDYKNVSLKNAVWEAIGKELNQNSDAVKSKWKTLRDGYTKSKKHIKGTTPSGRKNTQYLWSPQLSFLDNVNITKTSDVIEIKSSHSPSPQPMLSPNQDSDSQDFSSTPYDPLSLPTLQQYPQQESPASPSQLQPTNSKRPDVEDVEKVLNYLNKKKKKEHDGIDHLFLSYADTFKKFPPREQALMKLELAKLFTNTELGLLQKSDDTQPLPVNHFTDLSMYIKGEANE